MPLSLLDNKLSDFLHAHDSDGLQTALQVLPARDKGTAFEALLAELYRGNGWQVQLQGGRGDAGADILLYHPKTPSIVSHIIQAKNHAIPLTFDQVRLELIKFEEQAAPRYNCQNFRLVAINGFVREAEKLSELNLLLDGWEHVENLVSSYDPDSNSEPTIELFAHNLITYRRINKLWLESRHVAVVQATGTGKSYLIAKVLADHLDRRKVVLAPSTYIIEQQKGKVPWLVASTDFLTYSKLARMSQNEITALDCSLIVLDEFHRCGASMWGKGVQKLLDCHPAAKVLGTTATPIRYLDDSRDMVEELFDGIVAEELPLAEAIVRRILPPPIYISALYTLDEECTALLDAVNSSKQSDEEKDKLRREIKGIQLDWEKSSGVAEIFKKHLPTEVNKLIVFCKDQQHLDKMEIEVQRWFQKAGTHRWRKIYRVLNADPESGRNLEAFKNAVGNNTIHILFAIDMLNEGLHIPEVGAVILLRPTESPIIFYQQLGRCLQVGKNHTPVVFDLVNNFQNVRANDFLSDLVEAKKAESVRRAELGLPDYAPTIKVEDLAQPIEEIFENIQNRLGYWEVMFKALCEFKEINDHCNVPDKWPENTQLGRWVGKQRTKNNRGLLSDERIERLNKIGFIWDALSATWEEMFGALLMFKREHGHCKVPSHWPNNPKLRRWVFTQREFFKSGTLSEDRIRRLKEIGFEWDILESNWNEMFSALHKFKDKYGHCNVSRDWPENPDLSHWVSTQRSNYRSGLLNKVRVERLEQIGFIWDTIRSSWEQNYSSLLEFKQTFGHCNVPDKWPKNLKLSHWIGKQRSDWKKQHLLADRFRQLESIGFTWNPYDGLCVESSGYWV